MENSVSLVITSCDRFDLLKKTLISFFKFNTYPLTEIIIIEDSGKEGTLQKVVNSFSDKQITVLVNKEKLGQLKSIDKAYAQIQSKYIFHCEDDWNFFEYGFIEKSIEILENNKNILSVWLRDINEYSTLRFSKESYLSKDKQAPYKLVYDEILSFNPGLRRTKEYQMIGDFEQYYDSVFEKTISDFYLNHQFVSAILLNAHVEHLGWHRRVLNMRKPRRKLTYRLDSATKRIKAFIYKRFSLGKFSKENKVK